MKFSVKILAIALIVALTISSCDINNSSNSNSNYSSNTKTTFNATLNGLSEVPPIPETTATGNASLVYDPSTKKFTVTVTHNVVNAVGGDIGLSGAPIFSFSSGRPPITYNSDALTDSQASSLFENLYYVNIYSQTYPNGEIRGQLIKYVPPVGY